MSNCSSRTALQDCPFREIHFIIGSFIVVFIFMSPLFVFVLVLGFKKWMKQHFGSSLTTSNHIDVFTYNMVALDLLGLLGIWLYFLGTITDQKDVKNVGNYMFGFFVPGQTLFHLITCVERYLAVVHPIFYLRLRGTGGVRIRNTIIGSVWLVSIAVLVLVFGVKVSFTSIITFLLSCTSVAFCFCSLSVLCTLIRPGPGEGGGNREHFDQSKQRAFRTMMIITGILSLRFFSSLIVVTVYYLSEPYGYVYCVSSWSCLWFFVPSSLVLPLLFLHREGKLPGCGPKSEESI